MRPFVGQRYRWIPGVICIALALAGCSSVQEPIVFHSFEELSIAAEAGHPQAMFELAALLLRGDPTVTAQPALAKEWFQRAADAGEPRAQFNLGVLAYMGENDGAPDYATARSWFTKAAAQGNSRAIFNLGVMAYTGQGESQDFERATKFFQQAAQRKVPEAAYNLGMMAAKGEGTPVSIVDAYAWFLIAEELGSADAREALANVRGKLSEGEYQELESAGRERMTELLRSDDHS